MAVLEGAGVGAAIGSAVPGVGTLAGAIVGGAIGLGMDLFNLFTGAGAQAKKQNVELAYQMATTQTQLAEAEGKKSAYQSFLSRMPNAGEALTRSTGDLEFDRQYRALLENFGNLNVLAGATGQVGPGTSMALVSNQAKRDVGSFVDTQKEIAQRQLSIYSTASETLASALTETEKVKKNPDFFTGLGNFLNTGSWTG